LLLQFCTCRFFNSVLAAFSPTMMGCGDDGDDGDDDEDDVE
jgi:hypothetical protein